MGYIQDLVNSHEFKIAFLKVHRKLHTVRNVATAFLGPDPWAGLSMLGIRQTSPIHHAPDTSRPVMARVDAEHWDGHAGSPFRMNGEDTFLPALVQVYLVGVTGPSPKRKVLDLTAEPLGSEDLELGVRVPPVETFQAGDEVLSDLWQRPPALSVTGGVMRT